jgi:hypothetical protein
MRRAHREEGRRAERSNADAFVGARLALALDLVGQYAEAIAGLGDVVRLLEGWAEELRAA